MRIGILGSGMVGQTIGAKLAERGEDVVLGTRSPDDLGGKRGMGGALSEWLSRVGARGRLGSFAEAAEHGEIVINATSGDGSLAALHMAGAKALDGKILIDIANPLDFSKGMPPTLFVSGSDSLGEQLQRAVPDAKVVKALNTMNCNLMVDASRVPDTDVFVCGNDKEAKAAVARLLREDFGWASVIDLGDVTNARGTESYLLLWIRLYGTLGTADFNIKVKKG